MDCSGPIWDLYSPRPTWPHGGPTWSPIEKKCLREGVLLPHLHLGDPTPKQFYLNKMVWGVWKPTLFYLDNYLDVIYTEGTILSGPREVGMCVMFHLTYVGVLYDADI